MSNYLAPNRLMLLTSAIVHKYFDGEHMYRYGVLGDGSCFYYSLCAATNCNNYLYESQPKQVKIGKKFRCSFTDNLTPSKWKAFVQQHGFLEQDLRTVKDKFCTPSVWADEPLIQYVMEHTGLDIVFVDETLTRLYCNVGNPSAQKVVIILWSNKSHFEPVARVTATKRGKTQVQMLFHKKRDREFLESFLSKFTSECGTKKYLQ